MKLRLRDKSLKWIGGIGVKRRTKIIILCTSIAVTLACLYGAIQLYKYYYYNAFDKYGSLSPLYEVTKMEKSDSNSYLVVKWDDKTKDEIKQFENVGFKCLNASWYTRIL